MELEIPTGIAKFEEGFHSTHINSHADQFKIQELMDNWGAFDLRDMTARCGCKGVGGDLRGNSFICQNILANKE